MMKVKNCFKLPNALILDKNLHYSAKNICALLYRHSNNQMTTMSKDKIAKILGCSIVTVEKMLNELISAGYIVKLRNFHFSQKRQQFENAANTYALRLETSRGFSLVKNDIFKNRKGKLSFSSIVLYFYLCFEGFTKGRAFPSKSRISDMIGMCKSTALRAISALLRAAYILVWNCQKNNRQFASNTYIFLQKAHQTLNSLDNYTLKFPIFQALRTVLFLG